MTDIIVEKVTLDAPRAKVYSAIADSGEHTAMTGAPAELSSERGSAFTTHGGAIEGVVLDVEEGARIVHAWRPADWPAGVFSLVRYDFTDAGDKTELTLTHSAIPDGAASHLTEGWQSNYWGPLREYLAG